MRMLSEERALMAAFVAGGLIAAHGIDHGGVAPEKVAHKALCITDAILDQCGLTEDEQPEQPEQNAPAPVITMPTPPDPPSPEMPAGAGASTSAQPPDPGTNAAPAGDPPQSAE